MNNLEFFIGLACLFWFFGRLWPALMVDWGRQSLFEVRDNIFLLAASGDFDSFGFNDELYQTIRTELNSMIRYLEDINWGRIIVFGLFRNKIRMSAVKPLAIETIINMEDTALRRRLLSDIFRAYVVLTGVMTLRSPIGLILAMISVPLVALIGVVKNGYQNIGDMPRQIAGAAGIIVRSSQCRAA